MPQGIERCIKDLAYYVTPKAFELTMAESTLVVSATSTYKLDPTHGTDGDDLILYGHTLSPAAIFLNNLELQADSYKLLSHKILIIKKVPSNGIIKIVTKFDMQDLQKRRLTLDDGKTIIFIDYKSNTNILTFCSKNVINKSDFITTITANVMHYPILLAPGNRIYQCQDQNNSQIVVWNGIAETLFNNNTFILAKTPSINDFFYCSSTGQTIRINLYADTDLDLGRTAIDVIKACCLWYSKKYSKKVPYDIFNILAMSKFSDYAYCAQNLFIYDMHAIYSKHRNDVDEHVCNIAITIATHFFRSFCQIEHTTADQQDLEIDFLEELLSDHYSQAQTRTYACKPEIKTCFKMQIETNVILMDFILNCLNSSSVNSNRTLIEVPPLVENLSPILFSQSLTNSQKADLLKLPSKNHIIYLCSSINIDLLHYIYDSTAEIIGLLLEEQWLNLYLQFDKQSVSDFLIDAAGTRKLKNLCLWYLVKTKKIEHLELCKKQLLESQYANDKCAAFEILCDSAVDLEYIDLNLSDVLYKFKNIGIAPMYLPLLTTHLKSFVKHPFNDVNNDFAKCTWRRSMLLNRFATRNIEAFHNIDGYGYDLLITNILIINSYSPSVACELLELFNCAPRLDLIRRDLILRQFRRLYTRDDTDLSVQARELASRIINIALTEEQNNLIFSNEFNKSPRQLRTRSISFNESFEASTRDIHTDKRVLKVIRYDALTSSNSKSKSSP